MHIGVGRSRAVLVSSLEPIDVLMGLVWVPWVALRSYPRDPAGVQLEPAGSLGKTCGLPLGPMLVVSWLSWGGFPFLAILPCLQWGLTSSWDRSGPPRVLGPPLG